VKKINKNGKVKPDKARKLLKFKISKDIVDAQYGKIVVKTSFDLASLRGKTQGLGEFLLANQINIERWEKKADSPPLYGLELEGLAYYANKLLIGVKWPTGSDGSLLLAFDIPESKFLWMRKLKLFDVNDTFKHGISGLAVNGDSLFVASNPPLKVDTEKDPSSIKYYGKSKLWQFSLDDIQNGKFDQVISGTQIQLAPEPSAKLEAIAIRNNKIYLGFEGDRTVFKVCDFETAQSRVSCEK